MAKKIDVYVLKEFILGNHLGNRGCVSKLDGIDFI
jgi:hypothetical protein